MKFNITFNNKVQNRCDQYNYKINYKVELKIHINSKHEEFVIISGKNYLKTHIES